MDTYCKYTIEQISESGLLPQDRMADLKEKLRTLPYDAFTKDGKRIQCVLVAPTINGDSAFFMTHEGARAFMDRHIIQTLLTPEESASIDAHCTSAIWANREAALVAKAKAAGKIIPAKEWNGGVFCDDEYYRSVGDFIEDMEDIEENYELPEYLYAAKPCKVVDGDILDNLLDQIIEDRGWEDMAEDDLEGVEQLRSAIEAFKKANENVVVYEPDCSTLIDMAGVKPEK